jgi:hypothetical protein
MAWGLLQWQNANTNFHETWEVGIYKPTQHGDLSVYDRQARKLYLWITSRSYHTAHFNISSI